ncbi:EscF/YscF/HrpA family type III secretion system needle major subunit [Alcaligenes sp. Marseille-Q7550]|nr:hypothetical protein [Escherichia coli]
MTNGVSFNTLNNTIYNSILSQESRLSSQISGVSAKGDGDISQTDMLKLQQEINKWTIMIDLQSTMAKQISDSIKGVIQKSS